MILTLTVLITLIVLAAVLSPLFRSASAGVPVEHERLNPLNELLERKARLLSSIREIDFDRAMEKLSDEDYQQLRKSSVQQAAEVMRQVDRLLE